MYLVNERVCFFVSLNELANKDELKILRQHILPFLIRKFFTCERVVR